MTVQCTWQFAELDREMTRGLDNAWLELRPVEEPTKRLVSTRETLFVNALDDCLEEVLKEYCCCAVGLPSYRAGVPPVHGPSHGYSNRQDILDMRSKHIDFYRRISISTVNFDRFE
jgi:hypothetical protein